MISAFFRWILSLFGFKKDNKTDTSSIDSNIETKKNEIKQIDKEIEDVKKTDSLDNNIDFFNK